MQIGLKIGTLNEHFVIFHHIFFDFCWKTDHFIYNWSHQSKTHEKEEKNNFLICFTLNVAKRVLTHFLRNLNLKDPSQDVGYDIFSPICFYLLVNDTKFRKN